MIRLPNTLEERKMKKIISLFIIAMMLVPMLALSTSAAIDASTLGTPTDITDDVKWITSYDLYLNKVPVVRADAQLITADEYDMSLCEKTPGSGLRTVTFLDWEEKGMTSFFDDEFDCGDGVFGYYSTQWYNVIANDNWDDRAKVTFSFDVDEAGTYEFVFLGCAQIKADAVGDPSKDRGFSFSVDGGDIKSVNASKTKAIFRDYSYSYSQADLEAGYDGDNTKYFQPTYFYGITADLTAGKHTLEFYDLFYGSDGTKLTGNGSRMNFMGFYVEKFLDESQFDSYVYPVIETQETTTVIITDSTTVSDGPGTSDPTPTTTPAPADNENNTPETTTTPAPGETTTKAPDSEKPAEKKGCGSAVIGLGVIMALVPAALIIRRKED